MQPELFVGRPRVGPAPLDEQTRALAAALPARVRLGTSSWTFPGWAGLVWDRPAPEEILAREGLSAYAAHPLYRMVGVDRSFYAQVPAATLREWAQSTPEDFRFLLKAHDHLTWARFPDLVRYGRRRGQLNDRFLDTAYAREAVVEPMVEHLGDKLGPIVFQLPPQELKAEIFVDGLSRFLSGLPRGPLYAVEIRSPELLVPAYGEVLRATGAVHCLTVHPGLPDLRTQWKIARVSEGRALVVRWNLAPDWKYEEAKAAWAPFDKLQQPDLLRREQIARAIAWALDRGLDAWVIANNKAEGSAPLTLRCLAEQLLALTSPVQSDEQAVSKRTPG